MRAPNKAEKPLLKTSKSLVQVGRDVTIRTKFIIVVFVLIGLLLIAISIALPHDELGGYFRDLCRELGVVILAVFTVSMLYELLVQEKYAEQFLTKLRNQLQEAESNAAACAQMGILELFPNRALFEAKYPFSQWTDSLSSDGSLRIMARSLFLLMSKFEDLKRAIENGASIELCLFNPKGPSEVADVLSDLELFDVKAAISVFQKKIAEWVENTSPAGKVELRYHQIHLFDSFTSFVSKSQAIAVCDLSFGRDVSAKQIVLLDPKKSLGANLTARHELLWERYTTPVFRYDGEEITVNKLATKRTE